MNRSLELLLNFIEKFIGYCIVFMFTMGVLLVLLIALVVTIVVLTITTIKWTLKKLIK